MDRIRDDVAGLVQRQLASELPRRQHRPTLMNAVAGKVTLRVGVDI